MFGFLKKIFRPGGGYEAQRQALVSGAPMAGKDIALLSRLAADKDADVRLALAARLVQLLPGLSPEKHSALYAYAVQALGMLAQDEVLGIRVALASALKDYAKAPPKVVAQLARDIEREVSEPILRFCVALPDEDLLAILADHPADWAVEAVAQRPAVSGPVAEAVVAADVPAASHALVKNPGAALDEATLERIVEKSKDYPAWHADIASRKELSLDLTRKLAGFASAAVMEALEKRADFDAETRAQIAAIVKRRIAYGAEESESPEARVERYAREGNLSGDVLGDALAWGDGRFVQLALAQLAGIHPLVVEKMLRSGSGKPVVALCWKAGLPVRVAVELQQHYAHLPPKDVLYAKGGTEYPLAPAEIKWQLEFFGVDLG